MPGRAGRGGRVVVVSGRGGRGASRGAARGSGGGRAVVASGRGGAAGVQVTLSDRFEGLSRSAPAARAKVASRALNASSGAVNRFAAQMAARTGGSRATVLTPAVRIATGATARSRVRPVVAVRGRGRAVVKVRGRGAARPTATASVRRSAAPVRAVTGRAPGVPRGSGRGRGRGGGRGAPKDAAAPAASKDDMDADMDAWMQQRATEQEQAVLAPVEAADASGAEAGDGAAMESEQL